MLHERFNDILDTVCQVCLAHYGDGLISLAVFGSVARGTMRPDSDVDLLVVVNSLPRGRLARVRDFEAVEAAAAEVLSSAAREGIQTTLSPVLKAPEEVQKGSLLFLDMVDQAVILYDRDRFLRCYLDQLKARLEALGARRVYRRGGYYWLLKPDLKPGEGITL
jgi:predicted nucleotidyltransferase